MLAGAPARALDEDTGQFAAEVSDLLQDSQARMLLAGESVRHVAAKWPGVVMAKRLFGPYSTLPGNPVQES